MSMLLMSLPLPHYYFVCFWCFFVVVGGFFFSTKKINKPFGLVAHEIFKNPVTFLLCNCNMCCQLSCACMQCHFNEIYQLIESKRADYFIDRVTMIYTNMCMYIRDIQCYVSHVLNQCQCHTILYVKQIFISTFNL